jgi:guanosine-3',5'-bis(diphosphate) 3'-pyrophosphohydrolase
LSDFLEMVHRDYGKLDTDLIDKAYAFAEAAHRGQNRESGEPYVVHPVEVAKILLEMDMDAATVAAGLLHDVAEDTENSVEFLRENFGDEVALLVDGVTKLSRMEFTSREEQQAESLRKMLLAMAKDIRVVLIRLADRLHNMRTLGYCSKEKQVRVAHETLDIYAPLAHRLGIYNVKWELEDLSLYYLDPEGYHLLKEQVAMHRTEREAVIEGIIATIREKLEEAQIHASIEGRPKHFYSIYKKMKQQNKTFDQIYDLTAIRIIVDTVNDCYAVLGIVHTVWKPIPGRFKDYIAMPKPNLYQSLHTTLIGKQGIPFEVQIRTWEMHRTAEYGIAAHWKYKEQKNDESDMDSKLQWLRQVLEWQTETSDSLEFMNTLKVDLFSDQVFVFTPKGKVVELPQGANPIDFAYRIHSAIGNKCVGAKINGRIVQLDTPLKTGDIVEIITSNNARGPSRDWIGIAKTPQARSKIRAWLKKERRDENIEKGKAMLEAAAKKMAVPLSQLLRPEWLEPILARHSLNALEDLYAAVGYGGVSTGQVIFRLLDEYRSENRSREQEETAEKALHEGVHTPAAPKQTSSQGIIVKGEGNMLVRMSRCCNPVPPDPIVGFITRGRGVSIHRADCSNLQDVGIDPARFIEVEWAQDAESAYQAELHLDIHDRAGMLVEVSSIISNMNIHMVAINARSKNNVAAITLTVEIKNKAQLDNLIKQFKKMSDMIRVYRVNAG